MKRHSLLALLVFLMLSTVASTQETYSVGPVAASDVNILTGVINGQNGDTCVRLGLPRTCTQAQACVAPGCNAVGGASCTALQARTAGCRIFPITFAGRQEYVTFPIAQVRFLELVAQYRHEDQRASCAAWTALSQGTRDTFCTGTLGLAAGCNFGCP